MMSDRAGVVLLVCNYSVIDIILALFSALGTDLSLKDIFIRPLIIFDSSLLSLVPYHQCLSSFHLALVQDNCFVYCPTDSEQSPKPKN